MLNRRAFLHGTISTVLALPPLAEAQEAGKMWRIGYLSAGSPDSYSVTFLDGLRDLGWTEGQNLSIDWRWAAGHSERLPELAAELVRVRPDAIVTVTTPSTRAAVDATSTIPILFSMVADPVGSGFVASLARPGKNATGLTFVPELAFFAKQLEILTELVPAVSKVAVLWVPENPIHARIVEALKIAAEQLAVEISNHPIDSLHEVDEILGALVKGKRGGCLIIADLKFFVHRRRLAETAARARVPVMYGAREHTEAGGLVSYGPDLVDVQRRLARYVDRVLKGSDTAHLPVERPTKFELVINLKTAKALGLTIPPSLLLRADQVIE